MTAQTKQEDMQSILSELGRLYSIFGTKNDRFVEELQKLINSEVLSALEEIEKSKTTMSHVTYDFGHAMEVGRDEVIPLSAIESIKNRYKI